VFDEAAERVPTAAVDESAIDDLASHGAKRATTRSLPDEARSGHVQRP